MWKKHLSVIVLISYTILSACLGEAWPVTVHFGQHVTLTEMDYHDAWFENDPNNPEPLPVSRVASSEENTANVALTATPDYPGHAGVAIAHVGVDIEWDLGSYSWDDVKRLPVQVTLEFSYQISAYWVDGNGSANAHVLVEPLPWNEFIGYEAGMSGSSGDSVTETYTTTIEELGGRIHFQTYCQAHSAYIEDEEGHPIGTTHTSYSELTVDSIKIVFLSDPQKDKGAPPDSQASEGEPVNIVNGNMYIIKSDLTTPAPGIPFDFIRSYSSIDESDGPLGAGWTHNFNIKLSPPPDDTSSSIVSDEEGREITFLQPSPGQFQPLPGKYSTLSKIESNYVWEKKDKTRHYFNSDGVLQSVEDRNGNAVTLSYDVQGRLTSIVDTAGRNYELTYDVNDRIAGITDPSARTLIYQYDANQNLTTVTDPVGVTTEYEYSDPNDPHNITQQTIDGKFVYTYNYNDQDQCVSSTAPDGKIGNTFEYHPDEGFTIITDSKGQAHTKYYNGYGRVTRVIYADATEDNFTWDENLNKTSETLQDGTLWQYEYDARGNLTKAIDPLDNEKVMTYDANDNLASLTDELGRTTNYAYDGNGNLTQITYPDTTVTGFTYNNRGQPLTITDQSGKTTTFSYDPQGNLVSMTDPESNSASYSYDSLGRKISETGAKGNRTSYQYDALNRIIKATDALAGQVNTTHEIAGLGSLSDQKSNTTSFQYNVLNQLTGVSDPLGHNKQFTYDDNGNVLTRTDYNGNTTTYSYDNMNRLIDTSYPDYSQVALAYDAAGRLGQMTDSTGTSTYTYDPLGRLITYTDGQGHSAGYTYDENGNLASITYPGNKTITYSYDSQNRLIQVNDWSSRHTTYSYDQSGLLTLVTLPNGTRTEYDYDNAGRLTGLRNLKADDSVIASYAYNLDQNGNIISQTASQPLDPVPEPQTVKYTYGADNRLLSASGIAFTYDQNGNLTAKGTTTYQYDYENRLKKVITPQGTWDYKYDGVGNRVEVKENGNTRRFLIDPRGMTQALVEYDGLGNIIAYYVYGLGLIYKINAVDNPYYYHYNFTGHTVAMTDAGRYIVNKYTYTPFWRIGW